MKELLIFLVLIIILYSITVELTHLFIRGPLLRNTEENNKVINELIATGFIISEFSIYSSKNGFISYHPSMCPWAPFNIAAGKTVCKSYGRVPFWHPKYKQLKQLFINKN